MRNIFPFLLLSLVVVACNSTPYLYYSNGARCDEAYNPAPVPIPAGASGTYLDITGQLNATNLPPGYYQMVSRAAYFQDKASDLHIYVSQAIDQTTSASSTAIPCVRNYTNAARVPSTNTSSDLTSVVDLQVDANQNITGHANTLGYVLAGGGIQAVVGTGTSITPIANAAAIDTVYTGQQMDIYKFYKFTDTDGTVLYQIRSQKQNDAQGFVIRQNYVSFKWYATQPFTSIKSAKAKKASK